MKRDRRQRAVASFALLVLFHMRAADVSCQERHALWRLDSRQPDERQAACVQRAIFRRDANCYDLLRFQAVEHNKLPRPFQLDASVRVRRADCSAVFPFQAASSAIPIIPVVVAADATLPRDPLDMVAGPLRFVR